MSNPQSDKNRKKGYGRKSKQRAFTRLDLDRIEDYFNQYYDGVHQAYFYFNEIDDDNNASQIPRDNGHPPSARTSSSYWIGGHEFPALTPELFQEPYLSLPSTLQSKHRRLIYEICTLVGLYHTGVGKQQDNTRKSIVSVYTDGLEQYGNITPIAASFPILRCKPWYYRNTHIQSTTLSTANVNEETHLFQLSNESSSVFDWNHYEKNRHFIKEKTTEARSKISYLVNHPSECLRDSDSFNYFISVNKSPESYQNELLSSTIEDSKPIMIETPEQMEACAATLSQDETLTELAFDLEAYNSDKYRQHTCLIQLSTNHGQDYVIDVLSPGVWDKVPLLQPTFANQSVVKIGHGINGVDVTALYRDFGIAIVNVFDTLDAAKKIPALKNNLGLAKLAKYFADLGYTLAVIDSISSSRLDDESSKVTQKQNSEDMKKYVELKSQYQNGDWWKRPLKLDMIEYGLRDVRYLIRLRRILISYLIQLDKTNKHNKQNTDQIRKNDTRNEDTTSTNRDDDSFMDCMNDYDLVGTVTTVSSDARNLQSYYSNSLVDDENDIGYFTPPDEDTCDVMENQSLNTIGSLSIETVGSKTTEGICRIESSEPSLATSLRHNKILMEVLKSSQKSCLKLYNGATESPTKSDILSKLICRAEDEAHSCKRIWDQSCMTLYEKLVQWRDKSAKMEGIAPSHVCSLDLLVWMAYKRPKCRENVRRLCYFLPECLREDFSSTRNYLEDLLILLSCDEQGNEKDVRAEEKKIYYSEMKTRKKRKKPLKQPNQSIKWLYPKSTACIAAVAAISIIILVKKKRK